MVHLPVDLRQELARRIRPGRPGFRRRNPDRRGGTPRRFAPIDRPPAADVPADRTPWADRTRSRESASPRSAWANSHAFLTSRPRYLANGTNGMSVPSSPSHSFTLPIGEPIEETFRPHSSCKWRSFLDLRQRQIHHALDAAPHVHRSQTVVLQPQRGEGGKLLLGGRPHFVRESGKYHLRRFRHGSCGGWRLGKNKRFKKSKVKGSRSKVKGSRSKVKGSRSQGSRSKVQQEPGPCGLDLGP